MVISKHSGLEDFSALDMIYLPASWASFSSGDADSILNQADAFKQYVKNGGGLVVETT